MAAKLAVGQFALFCKPGQPEKTVMVSTINKTIATQARQYGVVDWNTGHTFSTFGCWLKDVPEVTLQQMQGMLEDDDDDMGGLPDVMTVDSVIGSRDSNTNRFVSMNSEELDQLAANRVSHNTKEQTKWGIKMFKGEGFFNSCLKWLYYIHTFKISNTGL